MLSGEQRRILPMSGLEREVETMSWTDERVERLKSLWLEGLSASQIAAELGGVTRNAVIGKVHRLGLSGRVKPQSQAARPTAQAHPRAKPSASARPAPSRPQRPITIGNVALKASPEAETRPAPQPSRAIEEGPITFERVTILNLTEQTCKWPVGDPGRPDFFFCGRKSDEGIPYCGYHARIAYPPSSDRRRDRRAAG
jgi:GcrA cell cycle regulator